MITHVMLSAATLSTTLATAVTSLAVRLSSATPTAKDLTDPVDVSPGLIGFLATFAIVVATVLLIIDMNRRVRRLRFRERQAAAQAELRADARAADDPKPAADD